MKLIRMIAPALLLLAPLHQAQDLSGPEIIEKVNEIMNPKTSHATVKMVITTSSGKLRTFIYESWSRDRGEKSLVRYLEPSRVKDQATLMLNHADDIWMYFPRTQRVRKLATHAKKQKMEGSDFSYEDMGGSDSFVNDFITEKLPDEKRGGWDCSKLNLARKTGSDSAYSRLVMWVRQDIPVPVEIEYYDEKDPDRLEKKLILSDVKVIDRIPTPMKMIMLSENDNSQTEMEFIQVEYNLELDPRMFTERELKK